MQMIRADFRPIMLWISLSVVFRRHRTRVATVRGAGLGTEVLADCLLRNTLGNSSTALPLNQNTWALDHWINGLPLCSVEASRVAANLGSLIASPSAPGEKDDQTDRHCLRLGPF